MTISSELKVFLQSSLITVLVATLGAGIGAIVGPDNVYRSAGIWFLGTTIAQFIIFGICNIYLNWKTQIESAKVAVEISTQISAQSVALTCAYCRTNSDVPIFINQENTFVCPSCKQTNGVKIQFLPVRTTMPIVNTFAAPTLPPNV